MADILKKVTDVEKELVLFGYKKKTAAVRKAKSLKTTATPTMTTPASIPVKETPKAAQSSVPEGTTTQEPSNQPTNNNNEHDEL